MSRINIAKQIHQQNFFKEFSELRKRVITPGLYQNRFQEVYLVDLELLMPEERFQKLKIVDFFNKGLLYTLWYAPRTEYFKKKAKKRFKKEKKVTEGGKLQAIRRIFRYYFLYKSIQQNGFLISPTSNYPSLFVTDTFFLCLDGAHRSSIAKKLGYKKIPALVLTPQNILPLPEGCEDMLTFLEQYEEPDLTDWQKLEITPQPWYF